MVVVVVVAGVYEHKTANADHDAAWWIINTQELQFTSDDIQPRR